MFIKEKTEMTTIQDGVELKSLLRLLYKAIAIAKEFPLKHLL